MGFFDNTSTGLQEAGGQLIRGGAALDGKLTPHDIGMQGIEESKQRVGINKLSEFQRLTEMVKEAALSGDNSPEFLGPRLDAFQAAAQEAGIKIPKGLIDHFKNNPVALGMSFDENILKQLNPSEQKQLAQLTQGSLKNPSLIKERDRLLGAGAYRLFNTAVAELESEGVPRAEAMPKAYQRIAGRYMLSAGAHHEFSTIVKEGMALEKTKEDKSPKTVDQLLIEEAQEKFPTDKAAQSKYVLEKKGSFESAATKANVDQREQDRVLREQERAIQHQQFQQSEARHSAQFQQTLAAMKENRERIPAAEKRELDNIKISYDMTDKLQTLHADAAAKQGGNFSSAFRNALLTSQRGNRFVNITANDAFTPEEKKLAAHFNTIYGSLYTLTPERALSEADATRNLTSFMLGNAPDQVQANLQSRKDQYRTAMDIKMEGIVGQGRNTGGYSGGVDRPTATGGAKVMESTSKSGKRIISKDGGKTWEYK